MNRWLSLFVAIVFWSCGHADDFDIEDWIDEQVGSGAVLSVTAMHVDGGEVIPYGGGETAPDSGESPDANTQFEIGSITKAFTNLLLAEMVARDAVSYETTIGELLGDDFTFANDAVGGITLLQLATHTSGLPRLPANLAPTDQLDPYRGYDEEALLEGIAGARDKQPLGNHYAYSNFGVGLLGYLLGQVQGDGYSGAFATILLGEADNPLAHDLQADRKIVAPAGGFDITRVWHVGDSPDGKIFWHNGGTGGFWSFFGFRPATNEAVAILVSGDTEATGVGLRWLGFEPGQPPAADNDRSLLGQYNLNANFGIGVYEMDGRLVAQASGQMPLGLQEVGDDWYAMDVADASLHFLRENGKVVALELAQNGMLQRAEKSSDTAAALTKESVGKSRDALAAYVGEYPLNPSVKFTIRLAEEHLEAMLTGQPFFPIFPQGGDKFFYKVVDAELHFERDEHGDVDAVVLHQGGIVQRAEKAN
ncbi:MAG: serine hydrolase [Woeseiaceae bacterium]